jgi:pimeloyl-ACP methyl ester carboxylesterase
MLRLFTASAFALGVALLHTTALAQPSAELPRRAALGVQLAPADNGGVQVVAVSPGLTADTAGIIANDVLTHLNGEPIEDVQDAVAMAGALRAGDAVQLEFTRAGQTLQAAATASPRPLESFSGAATAYGAVPFQGGLLRDILVTPANPAPDAPVVFFIQGYFCASIEGPTPAHPYRALGQALVDQGIGFYRIEKPGMGDSAGGPQCVDTDFETEVNAFREGLRTLIEVHGVDPSRIILFGHSMGGVQAPILADETRGLRGVAVYGTAVRSWHDYMQELFRVQGFFSYGADPMGSEALAEAMRPLLNRIFLEETPLAEIGRRSPDHLIFLDNYLNWNGEEQILFRHVSYWRGANDARLAEHWGGGDAPVLAMYGEADFAAIDERDHRLIADIVNHYRPDTARFVLVPRTGHGFGLEGSREEARARNAANGGMPPEAPFNPEVGRILGEWVLALPRPERLAQ